MNPDARSACGIPPADHRRAGRVRSGIQERSFPDPARATPRRATASGRPRETLRRAGPAGALPAAGADRAKSSHPRDVGQHPCRPTPDELPPEPRELGSIAATKGFVVALATRDGTGGRLADTIEDRPASKKYLSLG